MQIDEELEWVGELKKKVSEQSKKKKLSHTVKKELQYIEKWYDEFVLMDT